MKNTGKIATLAAALSVAALSVQAQDAPGKHPMTEITRAEALERAAERFDRADANGDGVLTHDEMRAAARKMRGERRNRDDRMRPEQREEGQHGKRGARAFDLMDTDGNGEISRADFDAFVARISDHHKALPEKADRFFERFDENGDGVISRDEMPAPRERGGEGRGPRHQG